jgi:hypothetical protein
VKRYVMLGRPVDDPGFLADHVIGDVFDADFDEATEQRLVGECAVEVVEGSDEEAPTDGGIDPTPEPEPTPEPDPTPEPEPTPEPDPGPVVGPE